MKYKYLKILTIVFFSLLILIPITRSYFSDTEVITGNIFSTGTWEEEKDYEIELKKPLDRHTYFLGQEIQILWKVKKAHPHSDLTFKIYLLDTNRELIKELKIEDLECGPPSDSDVFEKWCMWEPEVEGNYIVKIEGFNDGESIGTDENEDFFTVEEKPGKDSKEDSSGEVEDDLQIETTSESNLEPETENDSNQGSETEEEDGEVIGENLEAGTGPDTEIITSPTEPDSSLEE